MIMRCRQCGAQQSPMPGAYCISCREPLELVPDESADAAMGGSRSGYLAPALIGGICLRRSSRARRRPAVPNRASRSRFPVLFVPADI